ncbi:hypothetical protein WJX72_007784 [[Myrmecia] bisecta]|uniref:BZIP domain-containing protein n=1 Tax=[Myrmecia] bisecta TaxID=41462 RepID=A0AAW1QB09_9CHLO
MAWETLKSNSTTPKPRARKRSASVKPGHEKERLASLLLRNKTAQARYRARQKDKVEEYKATIQQMGKQLESLKVEKAQLQGYNGLLQKVARLRDAQSRVELAPAGPVPSSQESKIAALNADILAFLEVLRPQRADMPWPPTIAWVNSLSMGDHPRLHQDYIERLGSCLVEGGETVGSPAHQRLVELVERNRKVELGMAEVHPRLWRTMQLGLKGRRSPKAAWRRVLEAMQLLPEQKAHLLHSRQRFLQKLQCVDQQRKKIGAVLQDAVPGAAERSENAACFVQASQAADELQASLNAEHRAVMEFMRDCLCSEVITPVQEARRKIEPAPYVMDMLAVCDAVAEEAGKPAQLFTAVTDYFEHFDQQMTATPGAANSSSSHRLPFHAQMGLPVGAESG